MWKKNRWMRPERVMALGFLALILLSDGVEDAYENRQSMEEAIRDALTLETAQDAANAILTGAQSGDAAPADDQTVLVLRLIRARADAKIEEMYQ